MMSQRRNKNKVRQGLMIRIHQLSAEHSLKSEAFPVLLQELKAQQVYCTVSEQESEILRKS